MSTVTASRTARRPRNTAASLIASEFNTRQESPLKKSSKQEVASPAPAITKSSTLSDGSIWDEVVLPRPIESHPLTEKQTASPIILVLIAFIAVTVLVKLSIGLTLITVKIIKKIAHQIAAFVATQMGSGGSIDYRVYQAIFD
jgi:hypothetical protein